MADANDLSSEISSLRSDAQADAAALRAMEAYEQSQTNAATPAQQDSVPAAPATSEYRRPDGTLVLGMAQEDPSTAVKVAKDIGRGVLEAPRNIVGGVRDAAQAMINDPINDLANWLEKRVPLGGFVVDGDGIRYVDQVPNPDFSLPEVRQPDSVTGGIVRGVSQWLTGFFGPGKFAVKGLAPATATGRAAKAAAQGAVADFAAFEEQEKRLSDLVQEFPALANPVNEYLASDKEDGFIEGRLKNALEGLGLGVVTEGMLQGLKAVRRARIAARAEGGKVPVQDVRPQIEPAAFEVLGDETAPLLAQRSPGQLVAGSASRALDLGADAAGAVTRPVAEPETFINFARIDAPEDVQNVLQQLADGFKGDVDAARRGEKMTFRQMELNAEQEDAFRVLAERRQGQPLNAEQSVAARQLWASSAAKLTDVAKLAAENPSEANLFAFRKMVAVHAAIQNEVIAARTETARALASWRIPAGSGAERFAEIDNALRSMGDPSLSREMADRIAKLGEAGMAREFDAVVRGSVWARSRDAFLEVWVNGLLSGPKTHLVNMMSNTGVIFQQMYERAAAAQIGRALGHDESVALGEATAQMFGLLSGFKDGLRYAYKTLRTNETGFGLGKIDLPRARAISSDAWGVAKDSTLGRSIDVLGATASLPGRALAAEDEFFKTIGYRMELNALALRRATQELNAGIIQPDQFKARIADIVADPPGDIRLDAIDQATYQTFNSAPGNITQSVSRLANSMPLVGRLILPFVRTPGNILRYTFERTPLAPLMSHVRADIAAGGARQDVALARIATGSMLMAAGADMALTGQITGKGPSDRAERQALERTGWQPYSMKIGDRYYAYNRLDPVGSALGLSADLVEILTNMDEEDDLSEAEIEGVQAAIAMSIANNVMNKTYMTGMSDLFVAMSDPERYGKGYLQRFAGSVVPTGVSEVARAMDPYSLEANTMLEQIRSRTPGLSESLPARRDLWGRPISYRSGLGAVYDAFSPIYSRREDPQPIDQEMLRLDSFVAAPSRKVTFDGVRVNLDNYPGAYSRYVQLAGNDLKEPRYGAIDGKGALEYLNDVVSGRGAGGAQYRLLSDGPDGGKAAYIKRVVADYRAGARRKLLDEYPALARYVQQKREQNRMQGLSALSGG